LKGPPQGISVRMLALELLQNNDGAVQIVSIGDCDAKNESGMRREIAATRNFAILNDFVNLLAL